MSYTEMALTAAALFCALIAAYEIWDHRRTLDELEAVQAQLAGMSVRLEDLQCQVRTARNAVNWSQYMLAENPRLSIHSRN